MTTKPEHKTQHPPNIFSSLINFFLQKKKPSKRKNVFRMLFLFRFWHIFYDFSQFYFLSPRKKLILCTTKLRECMGFHIVKNTHRNASRGRFIETQQLEPPSVPICVILCEFPVRSAEQASWLWVDFMS